MPSYVTPKKNAAFECYIALVSQLSGKVFQQSPTLAAGDVTVSIDNGAPTSITTLPVIGVNPTLVKVNLSAAEMDGDNISVLFADVADAQWCDFLLNIQTGARQIDDLAFPATTGRGMDVDAAGAVAANSAVAPGAITWSYTVADGGTGLPIPDVNVWVTSDAGGLNVLASGLTNAGGIVTFYLGAGEAYFWSKKSGMNFPNPDLETVA